MSPNARTGLLGTLLVVVTVMAMTVTVAEGVTSFGICPNYQSPETFDENFKDYLVAATNGFKLHLTTMPESDEGCYDFLFLSNDSFTLNYIRSNHERADQHMGVFEVEPKTHSSAGSLFLGTPGSVLGSRLFGGIRMYVLAIDVDTFSVITCSSSGVLKSEHVHVFVLTDALSAYQSIPPPRSNFADLPHFDSLRLVDNECIAPPPQAPSGLILDFMAMMGMACPSAREIINQYRSLLEQDPTLSASTHKFISNNDVLVRDITHLRTNKPSLPFPNYQYFHANDIPVQSVTNSRIGNSASPFSNYQSFSHSGVPVQVVNSPRITNPVSPFSNYQFFSHSGVPVQVVNSPRISNPVSPFSNYQSFSQSGIPVQVVNSPRITNPVSPFPNYQIFSHNEVPVQIMTNHRNGKNVKADLTE